MATYIKSEPSTNGITHPTDAGTLIRGDEWGIDNLLEGFIILSESISEELITDTTQDQKGAVVSQLDYDKHWTCTLNVIGDKDVAPITGDSSAIDAGDITVSYAGKVWKCNGVLYAGAYNDKKKWTITLERWINFPTHSDD